MNPEWIDDVFYVKNQRWGTWVSYDKEDKPIITSLTEEQCISATRFYLKFRQENQFKSKNSENEVSKYSGTMDYKL
jgi:hypothetical protein